MTAQLLAKFLVVVFLLFCLALARKTRLVVDGYAWVGVHGWGGVGHPSCVCCVCVWFYVTRRRAMRAGGIERTWFSLGSPMHRDGYAFQVRVLRRLLLLFPFLPAHGAAGRELEARAPPWLLRLRGLLGGGGGSGLLGLRGADQRQAGGVHRRCVGGRRGGRLRERGGGVRR